jgi:hypothetical protein
MAERTRDSRLASLVNHMLSSDDLGFEDFSIEDFVQRHEKSSPERVLIRLRSNRPKKLLFLDDTHDEIKSLSRRVSRLEARVFGRPPMRTRGEVVYRKLLPELRGSEGRIVAIDLENEEVVGEGSTIEEAYARAREMQPGKTQFYFRRVGKSYLLRI